MRCVDCAYWKPPTPRRWVQPEEQEKAGICGKARDWAERYPGAICAANGEPLNSFGAADVEGCHARVLTGPEFGCIHFTCR